MNTFKHDLDFTVHRMISIITTFIIRVHLKGLIGDHWTFIGSYHLIELATGRGAQEGRGGARGGVNG